MSTIVDLGKITASVTVGTTTTGAAGTNASVSNSGTTQDSVLNFTIPRGAQGVQGPQGSTGPQGPAGPTGPQGPMGDVAVITPEQQAAFTMYSVPGQNTDGPMTQKAVTDALVAGSISYDNSQGSLASDNVQGALDEIAENTSEQVPVILGTATQGYIIKADGTWSSNSNTHSYWAIPCREGDKFSILANSVNTSYYAWLHSVNASTNVMADYASGETGRHTIAANKIVSITAPAQTNYLYITNTNNNNDQSPQLVKNILFDKKRIDNLEENLENLNVEIEIPLSLYPNGTGFIDSSGFTPSTTYFGKFVEISSLREKKIFLRQQTPKVIRYAFLRSIPSSSSIDYATGASYKNYTTTEVQDIVPNDCNYIYIYVYSNGTNVEPIFGYFENESIEQLASQSFELSDKVGNGSLPIIPTLSILGDELVAGNGIVDTDGKYKVNSNYQGTFIPASEYRGKYIRFISGTHATMRWAFTLSAPTSNTSTSICCAGTTLVSSSSDLPMLIPNDCNYIYVYMNANGTPWTPAKIEIYDAPDITSLLNYIINNIESNENIEGDELDMGDYSPSIAELFNYYFPNLTAEQQNDLIGLSSATVSSTGMTLPTLSHITHNKIAVFDDENIILELNATTSDKVLMYASSDGNLSTSQVASYILFNFISGRISIYQAETVNTSTGVGTELCGIDFTAVNGNYILTVGRKRRCVFASIYNKDSREKKEIIATESLYPNVNTARRPAGWLYKRPSFMTVAGTPVYKRFAMTVKDDLFMLFQGDSYTEGYAGYYPQCWAYKAARYFRNSRTCGLSGHKLADIITQYHDSIKDKIQTKVIVISIGINDMDDLTTDALIATWANNFKTYLDELVADGIRPIVNRIWPEGSGTSSTATKATKMNNYIRSWGFDGADFGAVTGYPSNATYYTSSHLSQQGNELTYEIFINELNYFKCR